MSRVSNALNMYFLLQSRGLMNVREIAEELEVTPRMVKEYKKDLEMAGIYISSKRGSNGGYYLDNKRSFAILNITEGEISALKMAKEAINSGKYHFATEFELLVSKILNNLENKESKIYYYNKNFIELDDIVKDEKNIWIDINLAINQKKQIEMEYGALKEKGLEITKRVVNPYGIFDYKGATYFYGFCHRANDIRFFKLSRICAYKILQTKFEIKKEFNLNKVLNQSFGIYNDEMLNLKLKILYPMSEIIKEKQICKNQKITQLDEHSILFEARMRGYTEIKTWIMSMGSKVKVIEPEKLKKELLEEATQIINLYSID